MATPFSFDFNPQLVFDSKAPAGYRKLVRQSVIGTANRFDAAATMVADWAVQRRSGLRVKDMHGADAPPVELGFEGLVEVPLLHLGVLQAWVVAPFQVTAVVAETDVAGFAYGTLPGHPERGVEAFLVRRLGAETVMEVRAISRPAMPYALAPIVGQNLQRMFTQHYMNALL